MALQTTHTINSTPEELWKQFYAGDMRSFRKLYQDFYQPLYNYGLKYLEKNEVEDCIQDLFLYILQHRNNKVTVKNVNAYLFKSYRNLLSKKAKRIALEKIKEDLMSIKAESCCKNEGIITEFLQELLNRLSPREQEIMQLKYYKNLKNKEIAIRLDIEYQTVRNTLANAIKKMRIYIWMAYMLIHTRII